MRGWGRGLNQETNSGLKLPSLEPLLPLCYYSQLTYAFTLAIDSSVKIGANNGAHLLGTGKIIWND